MASLIERLRDHAFSDTITDEAADALEACKELLMPLRFDVHDRDKWDDVMRQIGGDDD